MTLVSPWLGDDNISSYERFTDTIHNNNYRNKYNMKPHSQLAVSFEPALVQCASVVLQYIFIVMKKDRCMGQFRRALRRKY